MTITHRQLQTLSHLIKTVSGHKPQCFLKTVVENTNPNDYKRFDGVEEMGKTLKEIDLLIKMFDDMDIIEEKRRLRVDAILSRVR
jgi:hypothetical protein